MNKTLRTITAFALVPAFVLGIFIVCDVTNAAPSKISASWGKFKRLTVDGPLEANGAYVQRAKVIDIDYGLVENTAAIDTGWDIPDYAIIQNCYLYIETAETTATTPTLDVGTSGDASNDPDGFLDGVSVGTTGLKQGQIAAPAGYISSDTIGALLGTVVTGSSTDDRGLFETVLDGTSGGESLVWTPSSADFGSLDGEIIIEYMERVR